MYAVLSCYICDHLLCSNIKPIQPCTIHESKNPCGHLITLANCSKPRKGVTISQLCLPRELLLPQLFRNKMQLQNPATMTTCYSTCWSVIVFANPIILKKLRGNFFKKIWIKYLCFTLANDLFCLGTFQIYICIFQKKVSFTSVKLHQFNRRLKHTGSTFSHLFFCFPHLCPSPLISLGSDKVSSFYAPQFPGNILWHLSLRGKRHGSIFLDLFLWQESLINHCVYFSLYPWRCLGNFTGILFLLC